MLRINGLSGAGIARSEAMLAKLANNALLARQRLGAWAKALPRLGARAWLLARVQWLRVMCCANPCVMRSVTTSAWPEWPILRLLIRGWPDVWEVCSGWRLLSMLRACRGAARASERQRLWIFADIRCGPAAAGWLRMPTGRHDQLPPQRPGAIGLAPYCVARPANLWHCRRGFAADIGRCHAGRASRRLRAQRHGALVA